MNKNTKKFFAISIAAVLSGLFGYTMLSIESAPSLISTDKSIAESDFTSFSAKYSRINTAISGQFVTIIGGLNVPQGIISNDLPFSTGISVAVFENNTQSYGISIHLIDMTYNRTIISVSHVSTILTNNNTIFIERYCYSFSKSGSYNVLQHLNAEFEVNLYKFIGPFQFEIKTIKLSF
jgi:hypothetical protein